MKKPYSLLVWGASLLFSGMLQAQSTGQMLKVPKAGLQLQSLHTKLHPPLADMRSSVHTPPMYSASGGGGTPPNDDCTGAVPQNLAAGATVTYAGDNTGATVLAPTTFVVVWEAFTTTTCTNVTINYCVPGSVFQNFLINIVNQCPDPLGGVLTGTYTDCTVSFASLPAGTYWIPVLVDPPDTPDGAYTISVSATSCAPPPPGYCTAGATSTQFEKISNVTYANINNSSTSTAGYEDFTSVTANVTQGGTNTITVTISSPYPEDQVLVWIDLNQNQIFEANELMYSSPMGEGPHSGPINIPMSASLGNTRMRVRLHDATLGPNTTPCGTSTYGQVEDYTVNIASGGGGTPPNDECTGAVPQNLAAGATVTYTGDNTGATVLAPTTFVVVWEAFTTTTCTNVTINYCVPGSVFENFLINIVDQCPDPLGSVLTGTFTDCTVSFAELPAGTYWIPVLVDPPETPAGAYTISVSATACAPPPPGYCAAGATSTQFEKISNVTFAGINNNSTSTAGYENFTNVEGNVDVGATYPISVTISNGFPEDQVYVWIDWNQNQVFDANELVWTSPIGAGPTHSGTVNVPLSALNGSTRMRVRLTDTHDGSEYANVFNATPCGNSTYGQVEDYTIVVSGGLECDAIAGTLSGGATICFEEVPVTLTATPNGNAVVPDDFEVLYALTQGAGLVIIDVDAAPSFVVGATGLYTIHTLVYDPATLDLSIVELGVTTGFDVNGLLIQGGGTICASLDVAGAVFNVVLCCPADAGTLSGGGQVCYEGDPETLSATPNGDAVVPDGFETVYVLTQGAGLVIINAGPVPSFEVNAVGAYTIHTLVYDPATLDLSIVELGVTTGFEVNALLIQGGGTICASLDVAGAAFTVEECGGYCNAGADGTGLGLDERIINVTFANINNNSPNAVPTPPAYQDFTSVVGNVVPGVTYPIAIDVARTGSNTSYNTNQVLVWIDLNGNESFTDPGELVFTSIIGSVDVYTGNITIPVGTPQGVTRMRIRLHDTHDGSQYTNNFNDTPCGIASYGEVEDYNLNIQGGIGMDEFATTSWNVFPNPNTGDFTIQYGGADAMVAIDVMDVTGRLVHTEARWMVHGEMAWMALGGKLTPGTYILRFATNDARHEQRIVVR